MDVLPIREGIQIPALLATQSTASDVAGMNGEESTSRPFDLKSAQADFFVLRASRSRT